MAITNITNGTQPEKGIDYTAITDTSADWSGVSNSTYFYDLGDRLPHYKDSTGAVLEVFSESTVDTNLANTDLTQTVSSVRSYTIPTNNNSLDFVSGGSGNYVRFTDGMNILHQTNSSDPISTYRTLFNTNGISFNSGASKIQHNGTQLDITANGNGTLINLSSFINLQALATKGAFLKLDQIFFQNYSGGTTYGKIDGDSFVWGSNAFLLGEKISLQGSTTISGEFVHNISTTATVDANLINDSMSFHMVGTTLAGQYKDNLGLVTPITIGGGDTNLANTNLTLDAARTHTLAGFNLNFYDGQTTFRGNDSSGSTKWLRGLNSLGATLLDARNNGIFGYGGGANLTVSHYFLNPANTGTVAGFRHNDGSAILNVSNSHRNVQIYAHANQLSVEMGQDGTGSKLNFWHKGTQLIRLNNGTLNYFNMPSMIFGGTVVIGSEEFSIQGDTLVKGSDTASGTTGFDVIDSADVSKFEVRNNGDLYTNGTQGWTGTYLIANGDTVTVTNGLITNVAP